MNVKLPFPFEKLEQDSTNFNLKLDLAGEQRFLDISYGLIFSKFELKAADSGVQFIRGGIDFQKPVSLPEELGYRFSGQLSRFDWSEWQTFLFPDDYSDPTFQGDGGTTSLFFDVKIVSCRVLSINIIVI